MLTSTKVYWSINCAIVSRIFVIVQILVVSCHGDVGEESSRAY